MITTPMHEILSMADSRRRQLQPTRAIPQPPILPASATSTSNRSACHKDSDRARAPIVEILFERVRPNREVLRYPLRFCGPDKGCLWLRHGLCARQCTAETIARAGGHMVLDK